MDFWANREALHAAHAAVGCDRASAPDIQTAALPLRGRHDQGLVFRFECAERGTSAFVVVGGVDSEPHVLASFLGWGFWATHSRDEAGRVQFWLQLRPDTSELSLVAWDNSRYEIAAEFDLRDASDIEYTLPGRPRRVEVHIGPQGYCSGFPPPSDIRCDSWDYTAQPGYGIP